MKIDLAVDVGDAAPSWSKDSMTASLLGSVAHGKWGPKQEGRHFSGGLSRNPATRL